jgi:hypothetical protein
MRIQLVSLAFATLSAAFALTVTPALRSSEVAHAYTTEDSGGTGTAAPCWHDRECLEFDADGQCVHSSDSWMYYPVI